MNSQDLLVLIQIGIAIGLGIALLFSSFLLSSHISRRNANLILLFGYLVTIGNLIYFLLFFGDNVIDYAYKFIQRLSP